MKNWIINYLSVPFRTLALIFRLIYVTRIRVQDMIAHPRMQIAFKAAITLTVLGWFVIWLFRDKYRDNLSEALKGLF